MNNEILEKIGLTKSESRAYIALLELGEVSVGPIITKANISRSKIYDVLTRLSQKGLVGSIKDGKRTVFRAVPAKNLQQLVEKQKQEISKKEEELAQILPQLELITPVTKPTRAEILTGPRGIKTFFDMTLLENKNNDEILVAGYSKEASTYFHAYFRWYHKERIKRQIPAKVIYDYETWYLKKRGKRKYVEQRYLSKGVTTPAFMYIYGDTVGTIVFTKEQKLCFMIRNKEVAQSYKSYFMMLWDQAIKTGK